MSLDVYLHVNYEVIMNDDSNKILIRENGSIKEISREEWEQRFPGIEPVTVESLRSTNTIFDSNITHNLGAMAEAAGIYKHLWRPEELGITKAKELIEPLKIGLSKLKENPAEFELLNPSNGWGDYEGLVEFVEEYLKACEEYPEAFISVSR